MYFEGRQIKIGMNQWGEAQAQEGQSLGVTDVGAGVTDRRAPGHRWGRDLVRRREAFRMSKVAAKLSAEGRDMHMHELSSICSSWGVTVGKRSPRNHLSAVCA